MCVTVCVYPDTCVVVELVINIPDDTLGGGIPALPGNWGTPVTVCIVSVGCWQATHESWYANGHGKDVIGVPNNSWTTQGCGIPQTWLVDYVM